MSYIKQKWSEIKKQGQKRSRLILYILTALVILGWTIYGIKSYWVTSVRSVAAQNHALLVEVNNGLQRLQPPSQITTGVTSGNADEIMYSYQRLSAMAEKTSLVNGSFLSQGPASNNISQLTTQAHSELTLLATQLKSSADTLAVVKKFLQYNPQIDLTPITNGEEQDPSERANSTSDGLQATIDNATKEGSSTSQAIAQIIEPLVTRARAITATNATEWYVTVAAAQQRIITLLNDDFTQQKTGHIQRITELQQRYLSLK